MSLQEITERELSLYGVVSLPTRPGASREFGGRSYTPTELKEAFDRLPKLLAERYNELVRQVSEGDLAETLMVTRDGEPVSLQAYLKDITERLLEEEQKSSGLTQTDASYGALIEELQRAVDEIDAILEEIDDTPTEGSTNPVASGGVYHQLQGVQTDIDLLDARVTGLEHDQVEVEAFVISMRADVDTLLSIAKDTVVAVDTVEDTYDTRTTAGGLDIVDGTLTTVRKVQGTTQVVDNTFVNATFGGISSKNADGTKTDRITLSTPVELAIGDYIDVEAKQLVRATRTITFTDSDTQLPYWGKYGQVENTWYLKINNLNAVSKSAVAANQGFSYKGSTKLDNIQDGEIYIAPSTNVIYVRYSGVSTLDEWKNLLSGWYTSGNPLVMNIASKTVQSTEPISCPTQYMAYEGGTETIISDNGDRVTVTQDYYTTVGGGEA